MGNEQVVKHAQGQFGVNTRNMGSGTRASVDRWLRGATTAHLRPTLVRHYCRRGRRASREFFQMAKRPT